MTQYRLRMVHKIEPRDTDMRVVELADGSFSDPLSLAKALRDAGALERGRRFSAMRVEGEKVIAFPAGGSWHSYILEPA